MSTIPDLPVPDDPETVLRHGVVEVLGRMPWSSNATMLARLSHDAGDGCVETLAIYKPLAGERPLRDFPPGLHHREARCWALSQALGWSLVPVTIVRDGPLGEGSFQQYVPADHTQHYFTLLEEPSHHDVLRRLAVFDLVCNQVDRKAGHVLAGDDGDLWAIDNGLSFHHEFKVRSVVWDFAGEPISDELLVDLRSLLDAGLPSTVTDHLRPLELDALVARVRAVISEAVLPEPPWGDYSYPWPLI